jgi:hypothetical protein
MLSITFILNDSLFKLKISNTCNLSDIRKNLNLREDYKIIMLSSFKPYHTVNSYRDTIILSLKDVEYLHTNTVNIMLFDKKILSFSKNNSIEFIKNNISSITNIPAHKFDLLCDEKILNNEDNLENIETLIYVVSSKCSNGLVIHGFCNYCNEHRTIMKRYNTFDVIKDFCRCWKCFEKIKITGYEINKSLTRIIYTENYEHLCEKSKTQKVKKKIKVNFLKGDLERITYFTISCKNLNYENNTCGLCLNDKIDNVKIMCGHKLCNKCFEEWIKKHKKCPICVENIFRKIKFEN